MKKMLLTIVYVVSFAITITNLIAVVYFWCLIREFELAGSLQFDFSQYLAFQANQYSILQIYFVVFSIVFAILGFYGFSHIKEAAIDSAKKAAEAEAKALCENFVKNNNSLNLGEPSFPYKKDS